MLRIRKIKPIKLTNNFEVFFFKYKYFMLAFLAFNFWDTGYRINLSDSNKLITYSGLGATTIIVLSAFFMMPTYRKRYKDFWGYVLMVVLIATLSLPNLYLRINALVGEQKEIKMHGVVVSTCKSYYKGHTKYNVKVNMETYGKMNLRINEKSYNHIKKGTIFNQTWWRGSLGMMYWKFK